MHVQGYKIDTQPLKETHRSSALCVGIADEHLHPQ